MYVFLLLIFFVSAFVFYVGSFAWFAGKPAPGAKYVAAIFAVLFLASLLGSLIAARLDCPALTIERWPDMGCIYSSIRDSILEAWKRFP